jgi:glutamine amidotransferase
MKSLDKFLGVLTSCVRVKKIPFLGVCVGMQILASTSEEGVFDGLKWINGRVKKLTFDRIAGNDNFVGPKLPHMGWNIVSSNSNTVLMERLPVSPEFYFLHSYYLDAINQENVKATANHNYFEFPVIVQYENIYGVQFHPEKSHINGQILLENFSNL